MNEPNAPTFDPLKDQLLRLSSAQVESWVISNLDGFENRQPSLGHCFCEIASARKQLQKKPTTSYWHSLGHNFTW
jgi:hypothetical protein